MLENEITRRRNEEFSDNLEDIERGSIDFLLCLVSDASNAEWVLSVCRLKIENYLWNLAMRDVVCILMQAIADD